MCNKLIFMSNTTENKIDLVFQKIVASFVFSRRIHSGSERKLFESATNETGIVSFSDKNGYGRVIEINENSYIKSRVLEKLVGYFLMIGCDVISYFSILSPTDRTSIFVPELDIYFTSKNNYNISEENETNDKLINNILLLAGNMLQEAKSYHKEIEKYYISSMHFDQLDEITENLIADIDKRIKLKPEEN